MSKKPAQSKRQPSHEPGQGINRKPRNTNVQQPSGIVENNDNHNHWLLVQPKIHHTGTNCRISQALSGSSPHDLHARNHHVRPYPGGEATQSSNVNSYFPSLPFRYQSLRVGTTIAISPCVFAASRWRRGCGNTSAVRPASRSVRSGSVRSSPAAGLANSVRTSILPPWSSSPGASTTRSIERHDPQRLTNTISSAPELRNERGFGAGRRTLGGFSPQLRRDQ